MARKSKKFCRIRHNIFLFSFRWAIRLFLKLKYKVVLPNIHLKDKSGVIILCNHQTDIDGLLLTACFNKPIHCVVTDSLFSRSKILNLVMQFFVALIPKRKGVSDVQCALTLLKCASENGNIVLFPEGNRTYAEFQYPIYNSTAKLLRRLNKPIVFMNVVGGTGIHPRFGFKKRSGPFSVAIKSRLEPEEYSKMSDEELIETIKKNIKVFDSQSGNLYKSNERAEYLERMFFVCPKCGGVSTLTSEGNFCSCSKCGLKVEYGEDLLLHSKDEDFHYKTLLEWYEMQRKWVREFDYENSNIIFNDEDVHIYLSNPFQKRKLINNGTLTLTKDTLNFNGTIFDIHKIDSASPISGHKFNFGYEGNDYLVVGNFRFNPLKYILMFNRIDTLIKAKNSELYYRLEDNLNE